MGSQSPRRCLRMKAMLLVTLVFSLTILMMASRATAHSYGTTYYGKRMAEDTPSLTKRSPQAPPPAEGDEAAKPPVWCSFNLPWRGVSGLVDKRCQEIAGVGATK